MLQEVLTEVAIVVAVMLAIAIPLFIGLVRIRETWSDWRSRIRTASPIIAVLSGVLLFNRFARQELPSLSWSHGWTMTWDFFEIERYFVIWFQSYDYTILIQFFSFIYIYGYVFLLIFPVLAYFALSNDRPFRQLLTAYTINYSLGLICYLFVISYGPRNLMPELFETALYDFQPRYQHLTREVNHNTNVFPSLHTSMAMTVGLFAVRTRDEYPKWAPVAAFLAVSVAISTMYLGIHWAIDVAAGTVLATFSVGVSVLIVNRWELWKRTSEHLPTLEDMRNWMSSVWSNGRN